MSIVPLESVDDPRVADYRIVSDPVLLRTRGLFVAEGQLAVDRLLASRFRVRSLLLTESALARLPDTAAAAEHDQLDLFLASSVQLRTLTGFRFHRGCLGLGERPAAAADPPVAPAPGRPLVALDAVADPDNVGSIFRSAAAFGAAGVLLSPRCADPLYRKAIRTSMGTTLQLPFAWADRWPHVLARLRDDGARIVALTPEPTATVLETWIESAPDDAVTVLFGNEGVGVSPDALACCDERVRIAIEASVDSLNVATAAAIVLHRLHGAGSPQARGPRGGVVSSDRK